MVLLGDKLTRDNLDISHMFAEVYLDNKTNWKQDIDYCKGTTSHWNDYEKQKVINM